MVEQRVVRKARHVVEPHLVLHDAGAGPRLAGGGGIGGNPTASSKQDVATASTSRCTCSSEYL